MTRHILLIITGGIAAYKSLDLIRRLRADGAVVRCILTKGGAQFVTPLAVAALSENPVHQDIFSLTEESEMGHIKLARWADQIVVAPASADFIARAALGLADDLATTLLLAADRPVWMAPAMNHQMWAHPAVQANIQALVQRGVRMIGPNPGDLACGETGPGRMAEPEEIRAALLNDSNVAPGLRGRRALVTSGPTHEPLDPVRFLGNRSSGKQGHAIARALARHGADVTLITGPVALPDPPGMVVRHVETAEAMLAACRDALPVDIAVCAAAVSDWRPAEHAQEKIKKKSGDPILRLTENPDILASLAQAGNQRPALVIGFAAETENILAHAAEKLRMKKCDWLVANDVSSDRNVFGGARNKVTLVRPDGTDSWPEMDKTEIADRLVQLIARELSAKVAS